MSEDAPRENFMYGDIGNDPEPMVNRVLYRFEDDEGEEFLVIGPRHSITDVLNALIAESGIDEVEQVLALIRKDYDSQVAAEDAIRG